MLLLPDYVKITSYTKTIFDKYDLYDFESSYKKRKNKKINYLVELNCIVSAEELQQFILWFENDLEFGTLSFNSDFEILKDDEIIENFNYKFFETFSYQKAEGNNYELNLKIIRIVEACSFMMLSILNSLLNIQKNLRGENVGYDAHVSCPLIYQKIGISLTNLKNMTEFHPNDYIPTRIFA